MIVWIDLETSGLNPVGGCIIEAALVITDDNLNSVYTGEWLIQPEIAPRLWESEALYMHEQSGLWPKCHDSELTMSDVEETLVRAIRNQGAVNAPLGGSSVHFDRAWLTEHMPAVVEALSHRNIDVSSIKECVNRWYPTTSAKRLREPSGHRALADVRASISELLWYRKNIFEKEVTQ